MSEVINNFIESRSTEADKEVDAVNAPPHSIEAEQSILGGLLISGDNAYSWDDVG